MDAMQKTFRNLWTAPLILYDLVAIYKGYNPSDLVVVYRIYGSNHRLLIIIAIVDHKRPFAASYINWKTQARLSCVRAGTATITKALYEV